MQDPNGTFKRGAVVALDPTTGAILAAVSTPSYDPSQLSSHNSAAITAYWSKLTKDPSQPLLNRAFNQLYPPGSVFKVVVVRGGPQGGCAQGRPDTGAELLLAAGWQRPMPGERRGGVRAQLRRRDLRERRDRTLDFALAKSCNTAFAHSRSSGSAASG